MLSHLKRYLLDSGVEFLRVGLPGLVELERDLGVHAEGEVVVDHVQGREVHPLATGRVPQLGVGGGLQPPAVQADHISILDREEDVTEKVNCGV